MELESGITESEAPVSGKLIYDQGTLIKDNVDSPSLGASTSVSLNSDNPNTSNSDLSYHDEDKDGEDGIEDDDDLDYADDDDDAYMYDDNDDDDVDVNDSDDYMSIMQAKFDNADLPPGIEASVSWLKEPTPSAKWAVSLAGPAHGNPTDHLSSPGASIAFPVVPSIQNIEGIASSSSSASVRLNSNGQKIEESLDDLTRNYILFKRFDVVDEFSDHHYSNVGFKVEQFCFQPPKAWSRRIQDEWKILENDLPDTIYVRVCEARMDLMRAVIIGPQGTPYHDGLFVFDIFFPSNYPDVPPMVYYYSGGLRLNPNLYDCGKVCLSLLNTWTGHGNEKWMPKTSTMLQVFVSIQALILNTKPFFNEPGHDRSYPGVEGERKSNSYNENVFILSLKTMIYTLRRPPQHFEELVLGHFRIHAHDILSACKAYMEGAPVGTVVKGKVQDGALVNGGTSGAFKASVEGMVNGLISNFTKKGAVDCERFRVSGGQQV